MGERGAKAGATLHAPRPQRQALCSRRLAVKRRACRREPAPAPRPSRPVDGMLNSPPLSRFVFSLSTSERGLERLMARRTLALALALALLSVSTFTLAAAQRRGGRGQAERPLPRPTVFHADPALFPPQVPEPYSVLGFR